MSEIVKSDSTPSAEITAISTMTPAKRRDIHKKAKGLMAHGLAFGTKKFFYVGASLHLYKSFQLYKDEGFANWTEFINAIDLDKGSAHRYLSFANATMRHLGIEFDAQKEHVLTQQEIDSAISDQLDKLQSFTMRELCALMGKLDIFDRAVTGEEMMKLLPSKATETDEETGKKVEVTPIREYDNYVATAAKEHGWKYDKKTGAVTHTDGTPLSDEEAAHITPPTTVMYFWRTVDRAMFAARQQLERAIKNEAPLFTKYHANIPNKNVDAELDERMRSILTTANEIEALVTAVRTCDERAIKDILKNGMPEV